MTYDASLEQNRFHFNSLGIAMDEMIRISMEQLVHLSEPKTEPSSNSENVLDPSRRSQPSYVMRPKRFCGDLMQHHH